MGTFSDLLFAFTNATIALVHTSNFYILTESYSYIVWDFFVCFGYVYVTFSEALKTLGLCVFCCSWAVRIVPYHVLSTGTTPPTSRLKKKTTSWWLFVEFFFSLQIKALMWIFNTHMYIFHTSWYEVVYSCSYLKYPQNM